MFVLHFLKDVNPTEDGPVILMLHRHYSDTRNTQLLGLSRAKGVVATAMHTKVQPVGILFMQPFNAQETELRLNRLLAFSVKLT